MGQIADLAEKLQKAHGSVVARSSSTQPPQREAATGVAGSATEKGEHKNSVDKVVAELSKKEAETPLGKAARDKCVSLFGQSLSLNGALCKRATRSLADAFPLILALLFECLARASWWKRSMALSPRCSKMCYSTARRQVHQCLLCPELIDASGVEIAFRSSAPEPGQ